MRIVHRLPLFVGVFLLAQVGYGANLPLDEKLFQFVLQAPVYMTLFIIIVMMMRNNRADADARAIRETAEIEAQAKAEERRDNHELMLTEALVKERGRIDQIEEDRKKVELERIEAMRLQTTAIQAQTKAFEAIEQRTAHLLTMTQDVAKNMALLTTTLDISALLRNQEDMKEQAMLFYDQFAKLFPRADRSAQEMIEDIMTETLKEVCAEKRASDEHPVTEPPALPEPEVTP